MIGAVIVLMMAAMLFERNEIDLTELDASFRKGGFGQTADRLTGPAQNRHFEAMVMIDVHMERRDGEVVMVMVVPDQSRSELPLMVVVDIGDRRDAAAGRFRGSGHHSVPDEIPNGLGPIGGTSLSHVPIERGCQLIIKTDREPVNHSDLSLS